jgi:hypothetical protein
LQQAAGAQIAASREQARRTQVWESIMTQGAGHFPVVHARSAEELLRQIGSAAAGNTEHEVEPVAIGCFDTLQAACQHLLEIEVGLTNSPAALRLAQREGGLLLEILEAAFKKREAFLILRVPAAGVEWFTGQIAVKKLDESRRAWQIPLMQRKAHPNLTAPI